MLSFSHWFEHALSLTGAVHSAFDIPAHLEHPPSQMDGLYVLANVTGGIALLSYSMSVMSKSLKAAFGSSLREAIRFACTNRVLGFVTGTVATALLTSATATSLLVLQFVQNGDMSFVQSLGVSLGINVGSTLNAHLLAFQIHRYGMLLVATGYLLQIINSNTIVFHIGETAFGLGLLFLSITCMGAGMGPLRDYKPFLGLLAHLDNAVLAMIVAGACAVVFQSSNTVIALAIMLGSQGFISLEVAVYFVMGANIGTCFTSIIASFGKNRTTQQVAIAYLIMKAIGVLVIWPFLPQFLAVIDASTSSARLRAEEKALADAMASGLVFTGVDRYNVALDTLDTIRETAKRAVMPTQIANAHTLVNAVVAIMFMPMLSWFGKFVQLIMPDSKTANVGGVHAHDRDATGLQMPTETSRHVPPQVRRRVGEDVAHSMLESDEENNDTLPLISAVKRR